MGKTGAFKMLGENEWNTINNILLELYTINDINSLAKKIMKIIRMLIPYKKGWLLLFDDDEKIIEDKSYFTGFEENSQKAYIEKYYKEDYIKYLYDFASETNVYRDTNILESEIRKNTTFYRNFLEPEDIVYGCGIMAMRNGNIIAFFNLFRNEKSGDFTDKELYILNILKKHFENMVHNVTQISRANVSVEKNIELFAEKYDLTSREKEILHLINKGESNQEIADTLFISLSTVKKHIYNLYSKTDVSSRGQLVSLFLE